MGCSEPSSTGDGVMIEHERREQVAGARWRRSGDVIGSTPQCQNGERGSHRLRARATSNEITSRSSRITVDAAGELGFQALHRRIGSVTSVP